MCVATSQWRLFQLARARARKVISLYRAEYKLVHAAGARCISADEHHARVQSILTRQISAYTTRRISLYTRLVRGAYQLMSTAPRRAAAAAAAAVAAPGIVGFFTLKKKMYYHDKSTNKFGFVVIHENGYALETSIYVLRVRTYRVWQNSVRQKVSY